MTSIQLPPAFGFDLRKRFRLKWVRTRIMECLPTQVCRVTGGLRSYFSMRIYDRHWSMI